MEHGARISHLRGGSTPEKGAEAPDDRWITAHKEDVQTGAPADLRFLGSQEMLDRPRGELASWRVGGRPRLPTEIADLSPRLASS